MRNVADAEASVPETYGMPVAFSGCFGWLHGGGGEVGVVICPAIGRDAPISHTTLRRLAVELAQAGYPTLRFDYPGTGDSEDVADGDPAAAWMQGIDDAIGFLRGTGVKRIVLCGLRLGALFALLKASDHPDIDDIVAIDPVTSGSLFLRELGIAASFGVDRPGLTDSTLEIDGVALAGGAASTLQAMNVFSLRDAPGKRLLILGSSTSRASDRLASHMESLGMDVAQARYERFTEYGGDGYAGAAVGLDEIRSWLPLPVARSDQAPAHPASEAVLGGSSFQERPLQFARHLFGTLCQPRDDVRPGRVVVIGNAGGGPRYGHARFHVRLARRLAAAGIASLRFDFGGLGDSGSGAFEAPTHLYDTDRISDISAALDALETLGYRTFIAAGICSGGYHAWQASLHDPRIDTLLMVNPATFSWRPGQSLDTLMQASARSARFYIATLSRRGGWKRLVRRQFDMRRALRTVQAHARRRLSAGVETAAGLAGWSTERGAPLKAMRGLGRRGARVLVVMAADDAGLDVLSAHFGRDGHRLSAIAGNAVRIVPELDHSVTLGSAQDEVADILLEFLNRASDRPPLPAHFRQETAELRPALLPREAI